MEGLNSKSHDSPDPAIVWIILEKTTEQHQLTTMRTIANNKCDCYLSAVSKKPRYENKLTATCFRNTQRFPSSIWLRLHLYFWLLIFLSLSSQLRANEKKSRSTQRLETHASLLCFCPLLGLLVRLLKSFTVTHEQRHWQSSEQIEKSNQPANQHWKEFGQTRGTKTIQNQCPSTDNLPPSLLASTYSSVFSRPLASIQPVK